MVTNNNFGVFNTDDPNQPINSGPRNPTIAQLENSSFLPQFVNTPDQGLQFQSINAPSNAAANTSVLNRYGIDLGTSQLSNPGSVQQGTQPATYVQNSVTAANTILKTFADNVLDDFDNITYNFKLSLAPEDQLLNPNTDPTGPFYIVAQSGVSTNFYIKTVDIESTVSPSDKTRSIHSTLFSIVIVEPQGASLIDKLLTAGAALGIKNIKTVPMILELSFKGYNINGIQSEVNIAKRTWRIQTLDIQTTMNEGGSEYNLNFAILSDHAFNRFSYAAVLQQQLTIPVDTVGQFFSDLGYNLTQLSKNNVALQGQVARSEYVFSVDPTMANWKIGQVASEKNAPSMFIDKNGKRNIVLSTNITIDRILDIILASTKEADLLVNPHSTPGKMDQDPLAPKVCQIGHITGKVETLGFNPQANDYIKRYTYYISKFDTFRTIIDTPSQSNENRIQYLTQDALKKKYEYIFTGNNLDVLKLDLNLNTLWTHATTYYANSLQRKNNVTTSNFIHPEQPTVTADDLRDKSTLTQFAFTPIPGSNEDIAQSILNPGGLQQNYTPIPTNPITANPASSNIAALDTLSSTSTTQKLALEAAVQQQKDITAATPVQAASVNGPQNLPILSGPSTRINGSQSTSTLDTLGIQNIAGILIETLDSGSLSSNMQNQTQDRILNYFSKQVDPSIDVRRTTENLEETSDVGRSVFATVMNQLYQDSADTNLLKIELEIRGDPYWLGESDVEVYNRLETNSISQLSNTFANYLKGENCFFLTFKTPKNYNDSTGFVELQNADLFVGVYAVQKITHNFSDGKFTQKIQAIRDMQTNAKTLAKYIR